MVNKIPISDVNITGLCDERGDIITGANPKYVMNWNNNFDMVLRARVKDVETKAGLIILISGILFMLIVLLY